MPLLPLTKQFAEYIRASKWRQLVLLVLLQGLFLLIGFNKILSNPNENVFQDQWDGVKNYYTFAWYVEQPDSVPYLKFTGMNYPYQEYLYYTDNTPLVAVAMRWVHLNVVSLSGHTVAVYHWVMFISMWLASIVLFFILRRLQLPVLWTLLAALFLVWLHPQVLRFSFGTYNLGFSWALLLVFYGLLRLHDGLMAGEWRGTAVWSLFITGAIIIASFCHLYFLAMLLLWVGGYLAVVIVGQLYRRQMPIWAVLSGVAIAGLAISVCYGTILLTDEYIDHRITNNAGYGEQSWVFHFPDLFAAHWQNTLQFIFNIDYSGGLESHSYLGSGALFGWLLLWAWVAWGHYTNKTWPKLGFKTVSLFWAAMFISSLMLMFIAMSELVKVGAHDYINNYFNLFLYLRHLSDKITQFRALGRFVWPLFWVVNILLLVRLARNQGKIPVLVPAVVLLFMFIDSTDMLRYYNVMHRQSPFAPSQLQQVKDQYTAVDAHKYQAILPIPYYHVGSENYGITMDPHVDVARETMRFSMAWKLPLMACQMSRTAENQALALTGLFQGRGALPTETLALMDHRPVLVMLKKNLLDPCVSNGAVPADWAIDICSLTVIQETDQYRLYEWWPNGQ